MGVLQEDSSYSSVIPTCKQKFMSHFYCSFSLRISHITVLSKERSHRPMNNMIGSNKYRHRLSGSS